MDFNSVRNSSLWFDTTGTRTHDTQHPRRAGLLTISQTFWFRHIELDTQHQIPL